MRVPLVVLIGMLAARARADVPDSQGLGAEAGALAGAVTAVPVGMGSVHHQPALLAPGGDRAGFVEVEAAFVMQAPAVWVSRLDGSSISISAPAREVLAVAIGTRFDLGHAFGLSNRIVLGLAAVTPLQYLFRWTTRPDERLQWYELSDADSRLSLELGLGILITDWLQIGASLRVTFDLELFTSGATTAVTTVDDPVTGTTTIDVGTRLGEDGAVRGRLAPIVGVAIRPLDILRIGLVWRASSFVDDWGWSRIQNIPGFGDVGYVHRFAHYFRPHEVALGAALRPIPELEISADLTWAHWSEGLTGNHAQPNGRFGDTFVPALGVRVTPTSGLDLLAGYAYHRAPFANFGGPTNLLISDRHLATLGAAAHVGALAGDPSIPLTIRAAFRLGIYEERTETKDWRRFESDAELARNEGRDGYRFGGVLPALQLSLEVAW